MKSTSNQERALATYVRRVYYPLLLQPPTVAHLEEGLCAAWAHMDPEADCTVAARETVRACATASVPIGALSFVACTCSLLS